MFFLLLLLKLVASATNFCTHSLVTLYKVFITGHNPFPSLDNFSHWGHKRGTLASLRVKPGTTLWIKTLFDGQVRNDNVEKLHVKPAMTLELIEILSCLVFAAKCEFNKKPHRFRCGMFCHPTVHFDQLHSMHVTQPS